MGIFSRTLSIAATSAVAAVMVAALAGPALAASKAGVARALPVEYGRRDGSGVPVDQRIEAVGAGASPELLSAPPVADDPVTVSAD